MSAIAFFAFASVSGALPEVEEAVEQLQRIVDEFVGDVDYGIALAELHESGVALVVQSIGISIDPALVDKIERMYPDHTPLYPLWILNTPTSVAQ